MANRVAGQLFSVDTREVEKMATALGVNATAIIRKEMQTAGRKSVEHFKTEANALINHKSGLMAKSWRWSLKTAGNGFSYVIRNVAKSSSGFPYPVAVEFGRKAFGPIKAKALRFEIGGKVIFSKWVKAAPAQNIARRGVAAALPRISSEFEETRNRAATKITASI